MRSFVIAGLALALTAAASAAQYPTGGMGGRDGGMSVPTQRRPPMDPVILEGPPEPGTFAELMELDSVGRIKYDSLYARLMEKTQTDRDSLTALRTRLRDEAESGGSGAGSRDFGAFQAMRAITARLEGQQKAFDDALHEALTKGQWKRYQKWRDERRQEAEQERRDRMSGMGRRPRGR